MSESLSRAANHFILFLRRWPGYFFSAIVFVPVLWRLPGHFSSDDSFCPGFTGHIRMFCAGRRFCPHLRIDLRTKCIIVEKMSLFEGQFRDKGVTAHRPQLITRSSSPGSLRSSKLFCSSWPAVYPSILITSLYYKKKMPI